MVARVDVWVFWLGSMFWARLNKFVDTDAISITGVDFNFTNSAASIFVLYVWEVYLHQLG